MFIQLGTNLHNDAVDSEMRLARTGCPHLHVRRVTATAFARSGMLRQARRLLFAGGGAMGGLYHP